MANVCMLSTIDNPYNPFEQYELWDLYDNEKGHHCASKVARILDKNGVSLFEDLTQKEIDIATEQAIDEIIKYDFTDTYIKVTQKTV